MIHIILKKAIKRIVDFPGTIGKVCIAKFDETKFDEKKLPEILS